MLLREVDDRLPDLKHTRPIRFDALRVVSADEGVDLIEPQSGRGGDDLFEVLDGSFRFGVIARQAIRVVTQTADRHIRVGEFLLDCCDAGFIEFADIDVRDACVASVRSARGPAHDLDAAVAKPLADGDDFIERQFREDCRDKSELHHDEL